MNTRILDTALARLLPTSAVDRTAQLPACRQPLPWDYFRFARYWGVCSTQANKAMWLLYVMEMQAEHKEASAHVIAATFKLYFKEFGNILTHNIVRDLGSSKKKGLVNSDPTKSPEAWYLLAAGKTAMQALIQNPTAVEASAAE